MTIKSHIERKSKIVDEEIVDSITCDICKKEFPNRDQEHDGEVEWDYLPDVNNTTVSRKTGFSVPEGGATERKTWHICPDCFDTKLIPWLKSQEASPSIEESSY